MDYNTAKSAVDKIKREITVKKRELKNTEKSIAQNSAEMNSANKSYETQLAEAKTAAYKKYVDAKIAPIENKIAEYTNAKDTLNSNYQNACNGIDKDKIREFVIGNSVSTAEVRELLEDINNQSSSVLGQDLFEQVSENAEILEMQLDTDHLGSYTDYFYKAKKQLSRLVFLNKLSFMNKVNNFIAGFDLSSKFGEDKRPLIVTGILTTLLYIFVFKYFTLAVLLMMFVIIPVNVYRSSIASNVIRLSKSIESQLDDIDSSIDRQVEDEYNKKLENLETKFNEKSSKLDNKIQELKSESQRICMESDNDFHFDDSSNRDAFNVIMSSYKTKADELAQVKSRTEDEIRNLMEKYKSAKEVLDGIVGDLQVEYLNFDTVGTDKIFRTKFLLDVKDGAPVFFDHEMCSYLFLYDNEESMINFIRLMCMQLRVRLNPFNLNIVLLDTMMSGSGFLNFRSQDNSTFSILYKEDEIDDFAKSLTDTMMARMDMSKNSESFNKYNEELIADDSIPEAYYFIFARDPSDRILNNTMIRRISLIGGKVGIFTHIFYNTEKFAKLKESGVELLESINKVCILQDDNLMTRAKTFIKETILTPDKKG